MNTKKYSPEIQILTGNLGDFEEYLQIALSKHKKSNSSVTKGAKKTSDRPPPSFLHRFHMRSENFIGSHKKGDQKGRYNGSNFLSTYTNVIQDMSAEVSASAVVRQQQE